MAMRFVALHDEKKLSELIQAHFGDLNANDIKRVEKLLLNANPELKNLRDMPRGAVIRLPKFDRRGAASDEDDPTTLVCEELLDQIDRFAAELKAAIDTETSVLREDSARLSAVKRALEQMPELTPLVNGVKQAMKQRDISLSHAGEFG